MATGTVNGTTNEIQADKIQIKDSKNIFTGTTVEEVLNELFINADNARKEISSVIGSPLSATDTLENQKNKIQSLKNTMASNLTSKGQTCSGSESLTNLINKIVYISKGKRTANGTIYIPPKKDDYTAHSVEGTIELGFSPKFILLECVNNEDARGYYTIFKDKDNNTVRGIVAYNDRNNNLEMKLSGMNFSYNVYSNYRGQELTYLGWVAYE